MCDPLSNDLESIDNLFYYVDDDWLCLLTVCYAIWLVSVGVRSVNLFDFVKLRIQGGMHFLTKVL